MKSSSAHLALRETRAALTNKKAAIALMAATVLLALSGPFGTAEALPFLPRLLYWAVVIPLTYALGSFASRLVLMLLQPKHGFFVAALSASLTAGFAITALVMALTSLVFSLSPALMPSAAIFLASVIVTGAVIALSRELERSAPAGPKTPPLLERLELAKRGELISLSVQDHYVEVTTTKGTSLLLMRLSDAIREAEGASGMQVHRSHWVALPHVTRAERQGDKALLTLSDGRTLPASRSYVPALKEAGLLPR